LPHFEHIISGASKRPNALNFNSSVVSQLVGWLVGWSIGWTVGRLLVVWLLVGWSSTARVAGLKEVSLQKNKNLLSTGQLIIETNTARRQQECSKDEGGKNFHRFLRRNCSFLAYQRACK
jgi:hypothetical protein